MLDEQQTQPLLPRFRMVWFFVIAALVAVAFTIVRGAEQGQALQGAMVFTFLFVVLFGVFSAMCFIAAYLMGALEKAMLGKDETLASPFIDGLPEQIIPPKDSGSN